MKIAASRLECRIQIAMQNYASAKRSIRVMKHELPFSIDSIPIDVRIHTFLNKTPTNNFSFESFPLGQFLLIVLSVKVTYILEMDV